MSYLFLALLGLSVSFAVIAVAIICLRVSPYRTDSMEEFSSFFAKHKNQSGSREFGKVYVQVTEEERRELIFRAKIPFVLLPVFFLVTSYGSQLWRYPIIFWAYMAIGILFLAVAALTYVRDIPYIRSGKIPVWRLPRRLHMKYVITVWKNPKL